MNLGRGGSGLGNVQRLFKNLICKDIAEEILDTVSRVGSESIKKISASSYIFFNKKKKAPQNLEMIGQKQNQCINFFPTWKFLTENTTLSKGIMNAHNGIL